MREFLILAYGIGAAVALAFWVQSFAAAAFLFFLWIAIVQLVTTISAEHK